MQTKRGLRHASQAILLAAVLLLARAAIAGGQNASPPSPKEEAKNEALNFAVESSHVRLHSPS